MRYVVRRGDSFEKIAGLLYGGDQRQFANLMRANSGLSDLRAGMVLNVPSYQPNTVVTQADIARANGGYAPASAPTPGGPPTIRGTAGSPQLGTGGTVAGTAKPVGMGDVQRVDYSIPGPVAQPRIAPVAGTGRGSGMESAVTSSGPSWADFRRSEESSAIPPVKVSGLARDLSPLMAANKSAGDAIINPLLAANKTAGDAIIKNGSIWTARTVNHAADVLGWMNPKQALQTVLNERFFSNMVNSYADYFGLPRPSQFLPKPRDGANPLFASTPAIGAETGAIPSNPASVPETGFLKNQMNQPNKPAGMGDLHRFEYIYDQLMAYDPGKPQMTDWGGDYGYGSNRYSNYYPYPYYDYQPRPTSYSMGLTNWRI
jgi:hypothetical protein